MYDDTTGLIPDGTLCSCRFVSPDRIQYATGDKKLCYRLFFQVVDGPFAGTPVLRQLWGSGPGQRAMDETARALGVASVEELNTVPLPLPVVRGRARGSHEHSNGRTYSTLCWVGPVSEPEPTREPVGEHVEADIGVAI